MPLSDQDGADSPNFEQKIVPSKAQEQECLKMLGVLVNTPGFQEVRIIKTGSQRRMVRFELLTREYAVSKE